MGLKRVLIYIFKDQKALKKIIIFFPIILFGKKEGNTIIIITISCSKTLQKKGKKEKKKSKRRRKDEGRKTRYLLEVWFGLYAGAALQRHSNIFNIINP